MKWIDNIVVGLIEVCDTSDIYEILDYFKISIFKLEKDNVILKNNTALYYRNYSDKDVIFIRDDLPVKYEKFILSHELGHKLLHTSLSTAAFNIGLANLGKLERQANYFALKLSVITFDEIELNQMSIEQIASCVELPCEPLKQLVNI
ncbi:MAG: ImmA/IrrE family metallo-endopeptidase [Clostridiaceae bacterium]